MFGLARGRWEQKPNLKVRVRPSVPVMVSPPCYYYGVPPKHVKELWLDVTLTRGRRDLHDGVSTGDTVGSVPYITVHEMGLPLHIELVVTYLLSY